jgi:putative lipoic acid-binding regulatory protein
MDKTTIEFQEKLEATHKFPAIYMFKFIVLDEKKKLVEALFPGHEVISKPSSKGKYISITAKPMMGSSEAIIEIYKKAHKIEGIISL